MPIFDKTGPNGDGPMTGRGRGKCVPNTPPVTPRRGWLSKLGLGRGFGRGFGRGRGMGRGQGRGR